jgi:hypothetical protein
VRRWLRLLPLAALTLALTWSGARASGDTAPTPQVEAPDTTAPALPPAIATGAPARAPSPDFAFTNLRRF